MRVGGGMVSIVRWRAVRGGRLRRREGGIGWWRRLRFRMVCSSRSVLVNTVRKGVRRTMWIVGTWWLKSWVEFGGLTGDGL